MFFCWNWKCFCSNLLYKEKPLRQIKKKCNLSLPRALAENQAALLQSKILSGNISTMTSHFTVLGLHKIICDRMCRQFDRFCVFLFHFLINCLTVVFKCCNHSCRYKYASHQNSLGGTVSNEPFVIGGLYHGLVFNGVNKMSQLYKLDEKHPFANHLFCWRNRYCANLLLCCINMITA